MIRSASHFFSKNIIFLFVVLSMFFAFVPLLNTPTALGANGTDDLGANGTGNQSFEIKNPLRVDSITEFLVAVIEIILIFATPIIVIYIMYAGFLFVTANGEPDQLEKARNALMFAIIGGVIILGVFLIIEIIQNTLVDIRRDT